MRKRASAIIIRDKRLLLVSDDGSWFWTPGGKLEAGESPEDALNRELKEEINCTVDSADFYFSYLSPSEKAPNYHTYPGEDICYIVKVLEEPCLGGEITQHVWANREEIKSMSCLQSLKDNLLAKLITDELL